MIQHFTSIIPCHFSLALDCKPNPCRLVIDITQAEVQLTIHYLSDVEPTKFNYTEYNTLNLYQYSCSFTNDQNTDKNVYFYFFNNENDFKRFIFILTESGMIIPRIIYQKNCCTINHQQFTFLNIHSFIPESQYSFSHPSILNNIKKILKNLVKKIKANECVPFNNDYFCRVFQFLHKIEERKVQKLKMINEPKMCDSIPSPNQSTLMKKLISRSGFDKRTYKQLKSEMIKNQSSQKYSNFFQSVKSDCKEMNDILPKEFLGAIYIDKWSKQLATMCLNVCMVYIVTQKVEYNKNNFFIAMKIALLLVGGDRIKNFVDCSLASNSKSDIYSIANSIPSYVKKIQENDFEFEGLVYSLYSLIMKPLTLNVSEILKNAFSNFMTYLEGVIPYSSAYFSLEKVESFEWIEKEVRELFLLTFKNPWIVWFFIMRTNDPGLAVESVIGSIVYHMVPNIIGQNNERKRSIVDYWPTFLERLRKDAELTKDVVDVATCFYFYQKAEVAENSLL